MAETKQLNVELPIVLITRAKVDAIEAGVSITQWSQKAFENFLSKTRAARLVHLDGAKRKISGRKISV